VLAGEDAGAFILAAHHLRNAPDSLSAEADLVLAVALSMWGAIHHGIAVRSLLPPLELTLRRPLQTRRLIA
jgi:hypothetical protein